MDVEEIKSISERELSSASMLEDTGRLLVNNAKNTSLPKKVSLNLHDINKNTLIVLKGPTACGKSLFFKSLLGEYNQCEIISNRNIAYVG